LVATPLIGIMLNLEPEGYGVLIVAMALGTAIISLIGALGAALTLGSRRSGVLLSLLVLPLVIPVLIFGAGAVEASIGGFPAAQQLLVLGGLLLACLVLCPWGCAIALKTAAE
jgi:heme exporter protein B